MSQVHCQRCGQPFRVNQVEPTREYFCCAGCALRARVPVDETGNFPITRELIAALVVGFLYFNQLLASGMGAVLARQDKALLAQRFMMAGAILAFVVWLGLVLLQRRAGPLRGKDYVVTAVSVFLIAAALRPGLPIGLLLAAANGILWTWSFRGVGRKKKEFKP